MNDTPITPLATTYALNPTRPQTVNLDDIPSLSDDELTRDAIRCLSRMNHWVRTIDGAVSPELQAEMIETLDRKTALDAEKWRRWSIGNLA